MKVNKAEIHQEFKPFSITIEVESREEAQALCAIFNHSRNLDVLHNGDRIRDILGKEFEVNSMNGGGNIIAHGITYNKFYK